MVKFLKFALLNTLLAVSLNAVASRPAEDDTPAPQAEQMPVTEQAVDVMPAPPVMDQTQDDMSSQDNQATDGMVTEQKGDIVDMGDDRAVPVILVDFPRRGMSMDKVINELGQPLQKHDAIGNPPITRWDYPDRTVFFEYTHVVHVVAR